MKREDFLTASMKVGWILQLAVTLMIVVNCEAGNDEAHVILSSDHLTLSFKMEKKTVTLELEKNKNIRKLASYYTSINQKVVKKSVGAGQEMYAYVNRTTQDTIIVSQHVKNGNTVTSYLGSFYFENQQYSLVTTDVNKALNFGSESKMRSLNPNQLNINISNTMHIIEPDTIDDIGMDFASDDSTSTPKQRKKFSKSLKKSFRIRRPLLVDYFVIVDYSIYKWWCEKTGSQGLAIMNIHNFYSEIVNGIDLRYSTIKDNAFSIDVQLVGLFIATSPDESPWTERSDLKSIIGVDAYTDLHKALSALGDCVKSRSDLFHSVDHVALFTANHLCMSPFLSDGSCPKQASGASPFAGVCDVSRKISVNREFGVYSTIQTGAHTLGHSLGALRDGEGNDCSTDDQFVMAARPQELNDNNLKNPYRFSHCSIDAFRDILYDANMMCLHVACKLEESFEQRLTVDEQCKQYLFDHSSFYCGGGTRDAMICRRMSCWDSRRRKCVTAVEQRAYENTPCGNKRWCFQAECVYNNAAPRTIDDSAVPTYNAALKRPAFQSSVRFNAGPNLANDGNHATTFWTVNGLPQCSHTVLGNQPWWAVDLGESKAVYKVTLTNRGENWKLADNFVVGLSHVSPAVSAPVMWRYTLCAQYPGAVAPGATVSLRCRDKLPASRYVIVQFPAHTMVVCEIEVHVKGVGFHWYRQNTEAFN